VTLENCSEDEFLCSLGVGEIGGSDLEQMLDLSVPGGRINSYTIQPYFEVVGGHPAINYPQIPRTRLNLKRAPFGSLMSVL
jgi:hypothetical protein